MVGNPAFRVARIAGVTARYANARRAGARRAGVIRTSVVLRARRAGVIACRMWFRRTPVVPGDWVPR